MNICGHVLSVIRKTISINIVYDSLNCDLYYATYKILFTQIHLINMITLHIYVIVKSTYSYIAIALHQQTHLHCKYIYSIEGSSLTSKPGQPSVPVMTSIFISAFGLRKEPSCVTPCNPTTGCTRSASAVVRSIRVHHSRL